MRGGSIIVILCLAALASLAALAEGDRFAERSVLVDEIEGYGRLDPPPGKRAFDERVIQALREVERHRFVPESQQSQAYANHPLPIGHGQTISQPYIVALMTDLVDPKPGDVVLEVGTGSGYQAAVLARLVDKVYSIEIIEPLAEQARERLQRLGYHNVETRLGDGYFGWEEQAPFDAIVVTAAPPEIPQPLLDQLAVGGRLVIPVGLGSQDLVVVTRTEDGYIDRVETPVRFVPMTGKAER